MIYTMNKHTMTRYFSRGDVPIKPLKFGYSDRKSPSSKRRSIPVIKTPDSPKEEYVKSFETKESTKVINHERRASSFETTNLRKEIQDDKLSIGSDIPRQTKPELTNEVNVSCDKSTTTELEYLERKSPTSDIQPFDNFGYQSKRSSRIDTPILTGFMPPEYLDPMSPSSDTQQLEFSFRPKYLDQMSTDSDIHHLGPLKQEYLDEKSRSSDPHHLDISIRPEYLDNKSPSSDPHHLDISIRPEYLDKKSPSTEPQHLDISIRPEYLDKKSPSSDPHHLDISIRPEYLDKKSPSSDTHHPDISFRPEYLHQKSTDSVTHHLGSLRTENLDKKSVPNHLDISIRPAYLDQKSPSFESHHLDPFVYHSIMSSRSVTPRWVPSRPESPPWLAPDDCVPTLSKDSYGSNRFFPSLSGIEYHKCASPEETLIFQHYNASETVHGRTMEEWLRFAVSYGDVFRFLGDDKLDVENTYQRRLEDEKDTKDSWKKRMMAAFEVIQKLGVKFYCASDRDFCPDVNNYEETNRDLEEMVNMALNLQRQTGVRPLYFSADLFSHQRYANGASTNPDALVFSYAATQVKRAMDMALKLESENFVFFHPRDGYQQNYMRHLLKDMTHLSNLYQMAVQYKAKIGYSGQFLIQPMPYSPKRHQYESDAMATMHMLKHFGLEKHFKLYIRPENLDLTFKSYEHDVYIGSAFNMLGMVGMMPGNIQCATRLMKCILDQNGLQPGGLVLGGTLHLKTCDPRDLFHGHILTMDTYARALKIAAKMISDGIFTRTLQQHYISYESGLGAGLDAGSCTFEECEEQVRKFGEPQIKSAYHGHFENIFNHYVLPKDD